MGGLLCAKEIIDNRNQLLSRLETTTSVLRRALGCMEASINLYSSVRTPTDDMYEEFEKCADACSDGFRKSADKVAKFAAYIEAYMRTGDENSNSSVVKKGD